MAEGVLEADDPRNAYSINTYHMVCRGLYDLVVEPRILDLVEHILGPDFVCWGSHAFCKLPGDRKAIPMHQDAIYWPWRPAHSVTVWLAIDDVDEENAAMQFVRGSHLHGPLPHEERPLDGSRVLQHAAVDPDRYGTRVSNTLAAGEVSLHSDLLLHGSPPNASRRMDRSRTAIHPCRK